MDDIAAWLEELGLGRYAELFEANDITALVLPELSDEDLRELGVSLGHRRLLLKAIKDLSGSPGAAREAEAASSPVPAPKPARPEAERRQLTVMFADLVGSTALAARLDPEDMRAVITAYQNACGDVIGRYEGHVAKFMGDGVLAYFGYPRAHEDDAERAVRAGLELTAAVGGQSADGTRLAVRVGIATGQVVVGDLIGEGAAQEEAVVGETPNLAARLQGLAEPGSVVIAEATQRLVGGLFEMVDLGMRRVKGFPEPLGAWRVEGESRAESRFEAQHAAGLTPLVGRDEELELLLSRWQRARDGEGQVVLLSGEPGIGKSRLVRALRERLAGQPYTPVSHYCSPYHANSALHPVIGLLERAAGLARDDPPATKIDKLERLLARSASDPRAAVPLLAPLLSISPDDRYPPLELTPERQKQRTLEVLVEQLEGLAARQPVLALYEDVHWIDPSTLELLNLVIDRAPSLPVLVIATFRPEFMPPWAGRAQVTALSLSRLTRRHGASLVGRVTGGKALPAGLVEQIVAKTDGVPLFVEELTKTVLESGLVQDAGDSYVLWGPVPPLAIPSSLHDSLMARLDRLAPVKEVAQIGAVIGREFSQELLAAVAPLGDNELQVALAELVSSELVFRRGAPPQVTFSFKHALVQDAAYQSLLKSRRQQVHARIATVLEQRFAETARAQPELLAHHFTEAGIADRAVAYWLAAGRRAAEQSANAEAANHLTRGLDLLKALPEGPDSIHQELNLLLALGPVLISSKGFAAPEVERTYVRARALCERAGQASQLFPVIWGLWQVHQITGRLDQARHLAEELLAVAERGGDRAQLLQAHHSAWTTLFLFEQLGPALEHARQGIALYDFNAHRKHAFLFGGHDPGVCCRMIGALITWLLGFPDQARVLADEGVQLGHQLAHPFSLGLTLSFASSVHKLRRAPELVADSARALSELLEEQRLGLGHFAGTARMLRGWAEAARGRPGDGLPELRAGLADVKAAGFSRFAFQQMLLVEALLWAGERAAGLESVAEATQVIEATGERLWQAEIQRLHGELLASGAAPDHPGAERSFHQALETARAQGARSFELRAATSLARLRADQGKRPEAYELLAPVHDGFTEGFDTADLKDAKALLEELR